MRKLEVVNFPDVSPVVRHRMSRIRKVDTRPELVVRKAVRRLGFGYRLHRRDLPGSPDIVFAGRQKIIFVHGCFWHQHDCPLGKKPRSRLHYWLPKLERNVGRDIANRARLQADGWNILVVWECETRDEEQLARVLKDFLV